MFLTQEQIQQIGFKSVGQNVLISDKALVLNPDKIRIGSNVRIDAFTTLSPGDGGIFLGDYVHIACYASLIGSERMEMEDYTGLSQGARIISSTDDFSGEYFVGPTIQLDKRKVYSAPVVIKTLSVIGMNSTILPGVIIGENSAVGALSMVNRNIEKDSIYAGIPAKFIGERKKNKFV